MLCDVFEPKPEARSSVRIAVCVHVMCRINNNGLEDGRKYETALRASRFPTIMDTMFHNIILNCVSETQSNNK
jgi:hypothetical protein